MKKYFLTFYLIIICSVFFCCDIIETRILYIKNDSKSPIVCVITKKELNLTGKGDPVLAVEVEVNKEGDLNPGKPSWERYIEKCDGQKLHFYIINQDSINKYGFDSIFKKNMYIRKDYFTIEDLEKNNFRITYK
jgi:hypothetical protein